MTQVTANGNSYSDAGETDQDMRNGGFRTWLLAMLSDVMVSINALISGTWTTNVLTVTGTGAQSVGASDHIIVWVPGTPADVTFALPTSPTVGERHVFKYRLSTGPFYNLTVDAGTGKTVDGIAQTYTIRMPLADFAVVYRGSNEWVIDWSYSPAIPQAPGGRLTLTSVTPVMTSTVSGATTIYFTHYNGVTFPVYNGTIWTNILLTQLSNITTNSATGKAGPAAVGASSVYDLFVWDDAGTLRLTRGPAWTNTTTRSAGTALVYVSGTPLNAVDITNGPAASRGTYVGTVASNGSSTIDWILGASAAGGTAARLMVWNYFNRLNTATFTTDTTALYTYTSATIREANASAGNQIAFVLGLQEEAARASYSCCHAPLSAAFQSGGIGLDSTTTFLRQPFRATNLTVSASPDFGGSVTYDLGLGLLTQGTHAISANEASDGTHANVFNSGSQNNTLTFAMRM